MTPSRNGRCRAVSEGVIRNNNTPTARLAMPSQCQTVCHPRPPSSQRSHDELTCRTAQHPETLGNAYGGGQPASRKAMRGEIDCTGEGKSRTRTLKQSSGIAGVDHSRC